MRGDPLWWMWAEACEMLRRAERLERHFFVPAAAREQSGWEPPVDVLEANGRIAITVALPGVRREDVGLGIEDDVLVITGERRPPRGLATARLVRMEIPFGRFVRRIRLPPGSWRLLHTEYADGCLSIVMERL
ncbi:hypothetical protein HRbin40_00967 [bacterium HR40]|nr:hypothetical protein HRbin40_00967 [bacterium HR40]